MSAKSRFQRRVLLFSLFVIFPCSLRSQAWLSPKGQGTVSLLYQYGFDRYHAMSRGEAVDRGHIFMQALLLDVDYSLTDRLAVRFALPTIMGRYEGLEPHVLVRNQPQTQVALDNGRYHGGIQDFRLDVRYNLSQKKLMVTPFFQAITPSHDYPTLGHGASGTNQREYRMGANLGRRLDPFLPSAYVQARYAFGFVQQVLEVAPKRSYAEFQLGYILTRHLSLQGSAIWTHGHNGIEFINDVFPKNLTDQQWLNHDRIARVGLLDVGITATYAVSRSTSLFFGVGHSVRGANTHLRGVVVTAGVSKSFSAWSDKGKESALPLQEPTKVLVCTCAKSK
jgi:hypothetical protein